MTAEPLPPRDHTGIPTQENRDGTGNPCGTGRWEAVEMWSTLEDKPATFQAKRGLDLGIK